MPLFSLTLTSIAGALGPPVLRVVPGGGAASDQELVASALCGDRQASDVLVSRHLPSVLARARRLLGHGADAEDVVQDAFFEALRDLKKLQDPARFGAWVHKIAVHQVHRRFRRRRLRRALGILPEGDDQVLERQAVDPADTSVRAQLRELDRLLARHAPRDRLAWMLRHVEGLSLPEVAEQIGCSLATVKRRIHLVQSAVSERFGGELFEEEQP